MLIVSKGSKIRPILSVVIISHQQKEELRRCIDSVLVQNTTFPVEVIVSDDRSSDGTREMLEGQYIPYGVIVTYCNSDDAHCDGADRAIYNRKNALKYVRGRYLIHVDGDDYYDSSDIFETQVEMLERHPECTMCSQNFKVLNLENGNFLVDSWIPDWRGGEVVSQDEFWHWNRMYIHNSVMCMRLQANFLDLCLNSESYDDMSITVLHMGKGKIAMLNRRDFIYVKYPFQTLSKKLSYNDQILEWCLPLKYLEIAPWCSGTYLRIGLEHIRAVSAMIIKRRKVSDNTIAKIKRWKYIFILRAADNKFSVFSYCRCILIYIYVRILLNIKDIFDFYWLYMILYKLAVNIHIDKDVNFSRMK